VVAVAPRLFAGLMQAGDAAPLGERAWGGAALPLPEGAYRDVLTGAAITGGRQPVAALLSRFPVALLVANSPTDSPQAAS
jgi:(1->4)-alpha-D-glucan 1-alpha-D-glucosylmutase